MILNEDYFKDIEITDDDIKSSDDNYALPNYTVEYTNPEKYYKVMSSKYSHYTVLDIETETDNILTDSDLWTDKIPCMLKKLFYLFDSYGMEYSKPVVTGSDYFPQEHIYIENVLKGCKFFDFYGYKVITKYDTLEDLVDD